MVEGVAWGFSVWDSGFWVSGREGVGLWGVLGF